jgi:hypothetical protein
MRVCRPNLIIYFLPGGPVRRRVQREEGESGGCGEEGDESERESQKAFDIWRPELCRPVPVNRQQPLSLLVLHIPNVVPIHSACYH